MSRPAHIVAPRGPAVPRRASIFWIVMMGVAALTAPHAVAQAPDSTEALPADADAQLEALAEGDAAGDPEVLLDLLESLRETPLDINRATADELAQIPAIDRLTAAALVRYRTEIGLFASLPEIRLVEGLTPSVYLAARPYLTIGETLETTAPQASRFPRAPAPGEVIRGFRYRVTQRLQRRLDRAEGYLGPDSTRTYPGSPNRLYTRLEADFRRQVSLNVTAEKDPGEAFRWDPEDGSYGYDYVSGHAALLDAGRIDALIVGDFVAEFGQGLALWRSAGFGKGPDATGGPLRNGRGLRPYGSVNENQFFRGVGASISLLPELVATAFGSRRTLDASVFTPDTLGLGAPDLPPEAFEGALTGTISTSGLHRTPSEIARKDALRETLAGGALEMRLDQDTYAAQLGVVGTRAAYDPPLAPGDRPDSRFDFAGETATTVSAYGDLTTRNVSVFAEAARAPTGALGVIGGVLTDLSPSAELLLLGRHYARGFEALHGYPFGERNGAGQNETGLYAGLRLQPGEAWTVAAYFDQYRFPWLRFNEPRPTRGREARLVVEFSPRRWLRLTAQGRSETRETGIDVTGPVPSSVVEGLADETIQSLRVQGEWLANRSLRFRTRAEVTRYDPPAMSEPVQTGALLYEDVRWEVIPGVRLDTRLTLFQADGFGARLYQFENDLTGVFAVPVLLGRGARAYALLTLTPMESLRVQAKIGSTWLRGSRTVGSGADAIPGDRVRDLGLQVRYRF